MTTITAAQVKEARKLLGWSQVKLSLEGKISFLRIKKFEAGEGRLSSLEISTIQHLLEVAGVAFADRGEPGVRLRKGK